MADAIVAGHLCLDLIPQFTSHAGDGMGDYVAPGRLTEVGAMTLSTGGAVSNTGINLGRLDVDTQLMGKIGDDLFGRAILDIVRGYDPALAAGMVVVPGESSSYTVVINPPGVDRAFLHCPGANDTFGADDVRYDLLAQARLFHLGYPPLLRRLYLDDGRELAEMFQRAKGVGATTSLDLAMPDPAGPSGQVDWRAVLRNALPFVDLFVPSIEELWFMLDRAGFEAAERRVGAAGMLEALPAELVRALAEQALEWGARVVLLKLGTRGLYLRAAAALGELGRGAPGSLKQWQGQELWARPYRPRTVASTVGAGDAAIAGFLAAWLHGCAPSESLNVAAAAGASCVEEAGATRGVRGWAQTRARIAAGWLRLRNDPPGPGWAEASEGLWTR